MKRTLATLLILMLPAISTVAQISRPSSSDVIKILKAEDSRRYDKTLEDLMKYPDSDVRARAALAAGRIGDAAAIPALLPLLEKGTAKEREMAAFALGEIESIKAADAILNALVQTGAEMNLPSIRARLVEAAGKIAAANAKEEKAKQLGHVIVQVLDAEAKKGPTQNRDVVLLAITAVLRTRPEGGDAATAKFLTSADPRVRADAANTLSRLRAKNATAALRSMLTNDHDPVARANAARALGSADDAEAFAILVNAAANDADSRVRVSAIRSLGSLKNAKASDPLLDRAERLLQDYAKSKLPHPTEASELIEISSALGRLLPDTRNERAVNFLRDF
ncbi:MAG TPA: HEAT repeat domain-containing protein, partial [Pyrinomonadaceae bacterium]|nr:HEAT repeat domain-containing protein [Pyrinomonadaceae bacterium]